MRNIDIATIVDSCLGKLRAMDGYRCGMDTRPSFARPPLGCLPLHQGLLQFWGGGPVIGFPPLRRFESSDLMNHPSRGVCSFNQTGVRSHTGAMWVFSAGQKEGLASESLSAACSQLNAFPREY